MDNQTRSVLARFGIEGRDAETAFRAYLTHPNDSDGIRVARVLAAHNG